MRGEDAEHVLQRASVSPSNMSSIRSAGRTEGGRPKKCPTLRAHRTSCFRSSSCYASVSALKCIPHSLQFCTQVMCSQSLLLCSYVPPQRWLHNIEHGAVIMLYHPCAHPAMVNRLKRLVKGCIRKHIISAYPDVPVDRVSGEL